MKIYDLIVENLILWFFFAWSCAALFVLDSLTKNLDGGVSTFFPSTFSLPLQNLSLVVSSSFF